MKILGHHLSCDATSHACVNKTLAGITGTFWSNMARNLKTASADSKDRFVVSSLLNTARSRWARWSYNGWIATRLDKLQRRFLSALFPTIRKADETDAMFFREDSPKHRYGLRE